MGSLVEVPKKSLKEKLAILDGIAAGVNKKAGKVIVGRIGKNPEIRKKLTIEFIQTPSVDVNESLGGGFPKGRTTIVAG